MKCPVCDNLLSKSYIWCLSDTHEYYETSDGNWYIELPILDIILGKGIEYHYIKFGIGTNNIIITNSFAQHEYKSIVNRYKQLASFI